MRIRLLGSAVGLLVVAFSSGVTFGQIAQVPYASLTGSQAVDFQTFTPIPAGTNYDTTLFANGVGFGERFAGQTQTTVVSGGGNFDGITGTPSGPLTLAVGLPLQNLTLYDSTSAGRSIELFGNGPDKYPNFSSLGEGSVSVLFGSDQSQFGFQLVGGDGGAATLGFYNRSGGLIQSISITNIVSASLGFSRAGGVQDIAGVTITNTDAGGIAFDNLKFDVQSNLPEPASLSILGLAATAMLRRVRR